MAPWSAANIPDLTGKVAIVTGANTGLGFASALELARKGAHVFITSRDAVRGARQVLSTRITCKEADKGLDMRKPAYLVVLVFHLVSHLGIHKLTDMRLYAGQLRI